MTPYADPGDLVGCQDPTTLWVPEYAVSYGEQAADLYERAARATGGALLDPYQRLALTMAFASDPNGVLACFELAIILSRQNGKGEVLIALELAWLFLFGEPLIIHSAHLFETAREHFLKMQILIELTPDFRRRVRRIKEGRGSEEIELKSGARLKFMTRKGGAGLGFTGSKLVMDEAMVLDALMMGVGLPTMATKHNAQVIYTASAGNKESTQLAAVRHRGHASDPALGFMAWEGHRPLYDERGRLVDGDDPEDPATWARLNPAYGEPPRGRISPGYIRKEARVLGGFREPVWWAQRLGIGDYPATGEAWLVVPRQVFDDTCDDQSTMRAAGRALAVAADPETGVYTLGVGGRRPDGAGHIELIDRRRGSEWVLPKIDKVCADRGRRFPVIILRTDIAAHLIADLEAKRFRVESPASVDYAAACQALVQDLTARAVWHLPQDPLARGLGEADKRKGVEGGWHWDRDRPGQAPVVVATLVWWAVKSGIADVPRSKVW